MMFHCNRYRSRSNSRHQSRVLGLSGLIFTCQVMAIIITYGLHAKFVHWLYNLEYSIPINISPHDSFFLKRDYLQSTALDEPLQWICVGYFFRKRTSARVGLVSCDTKINQIQHYSHCFCTFFLNISVMTHHTFWYQKSLLSRQASEPHLSTKKGRQQRNYQMIAKWNTSFRNSRMPTKTLV